MSLPRIGHYFVPFPQDIWDAGIDLSLAEFRLFGYLLRHQMRLGGAIVSISYDELLHGLWRVEKDGRKTRFDRGCGVTRNPLKQAVQALQARGWITVEDISDNPNQPRLAIRVVLSDADRPVQDAREPAAKPASETHPEVSESHTLFPAPEPCKTSAPVSLADTRAVRCSHRECENPTADRGAYKEVEVVDVVEKTPCSPQTVENAGEAGERARAQGTREAAEQAQSQRQVLPMRARAETTASATARATATAGGTGAWAAAERVPGTGADLGVGSGAQAGAELAAEGAGLVAEGIAPSPLGMAGAAGRVLRFCGITDQRLLPVVLTAMGQWCLAHNQGPDAAEELAVAMWKEFREAAGSGMLRWTPLPRQWFELGMWHGQGTPWPWDEQALRRRSEARVGAR